MPVSVAAVAAVVVLGGAAATGAVVVTATSTPKVAICHRTASRTNPYAKIEVAQNGVDGDQSNDHGQGDHYLEHLGPIGPTDAGEWGDIIPPIFGVHQGRNWTSAGIAIYNAGCSTPTTINTAQATAASTTSPTPTTATAPTTGATNVPTPPPTSTDPTTEPTKIPTPPPTSTDPTTLDTPTAVTVSNPPM